MVKTPRAPKPAKAAPVEKRYPVAEEDRDELLDLDTMLRNERTIGDNERVNIIVEYAYLGQKPRPETYYGRPRYIKVSRHGRTRLAKRSARRADIPPPEEKMIVYDDTVAQFLHKARYAFLRRPGEAAPVNETSPEEDEHKEHSRDSGFPVSPSDKKEEDAKKDSACSSRGSVEKENRKRRSPASEEANSTTGTLHYKVMGNTPLSALRRKLEQKRMVNDDLRLELIDCTGSQYLDESWTIAQLANERGWTRRGPLRILYTVTRFSCNEDLPVLEAEANFAEQPEEPAASPVAPPHLQQLQLQQRPMHPAHFQPIYQPFAFFDEKAQKMMIMHPQFPHPLPMGPEHEAFFKSMQGHAPPPPHLNPNLYHHMMAGGAGAPPPFPMGGATVPQQQHRQLPQPSSIFPPSHPVAGGFILHDGNAGTIVSANMSVESVLTTSARVKKRHRINPKMIEERDQMMRQNGIEKGVNPPTPSKKMQPKKTNGTSPPLQGLQNGTSIRLPAGMNPRMLLDGTLGDAPITMTTPDGQSFVMSAGRMVAVGGGAGPAVRPPVLELAAAAPAAAAPAAPAAAAPALTPDERMEATFSTVLTKAAIMQDAIRRASVSSAGSAAPAGASPAPSVTEVAAPPPREPSPAPALPPALSAESPRPDPTAVAPPPDTDTPDSSPSLEIDEMMEDDNGDDEMPVLTAG